MKRARDAQVDEWEEKKKDHHRGATLRAAAGLVAFDRCQDKVEPGVRGGQGKGVALAGRPAGRSVGCPPFAISGRALHLSD